MIDRSRVAQRKAQPWLDLAALPPAEKNIKWKIICAGVESLIEAKGLDPEKVVLWVDWMCIYQDDQVEKLRTSTHPPLKHTPPSVLSSTQSTACPPRTADPPPPAQLTPPPAHS